VVPPAALPLVQDNGLRGLSRAPETGLRCDEVQRGAGALRYSGCRELDEQPGVLHCSGYTELGQARAEGRQRAAHSFKGDQRAVPERDSCASALRGCAALRCLKHAVLSAANTWAWRTGATA
jgi:hypothetical protein